MTRPSDRIETTLQATLTSTDGTVACFVRDISAAGAKVELTQPAALPQDPDLVIPETGEIFQAELRWRYGLKVGLRFKPQGGVDEGPSREALLAENAKLRETLEKMATRLTQLGERVVLPPELLPPAVAREALAPKETPAPLRPATGDTVALLAEPGMH